MRPRRQFGSPSSFAALLLGLALIAGGATCAADPADIATDLTVEGSAKQLTLSETMAALKIPL
jgi:hypothetical protein